MVKKYYLFIILTLLLIVIFQQYEDILYKDDQQMHRVEKQVSTLKDFTDLEPEKFSNLIIGPYKGKYERITGIIITGSMKKDHFYDLGQILHSDELANVFVFFSIKFEES